MNKYKSVKVETPQGERTLQYKCGERFLKSETPVNICEADCSYYKVCRLLPDPTKPKDFKDFRFCDFCTRVAENASTDEEREIRHMVPVPGTIENELGDIYPRILDVILEKNPMIYLSDVIDCICEFNCDMYDENHSQCGAGNSMCLLQDLFIKAKNRKQDTSIYVKKLDTDRDESGEDEQC